MAILRKEPAVFFYVAYMVKEILAIHTPSGIAYFWFSGRRALQTLLAYDVSRWHM